MRRRETLGLLTGAALAPSYAGAQGTLEKIRMVAPPAEDLTNLYYAIKTGMFAREGIEVEMIPASSGAAATTAVLTGTYEVARTSLLVVLAAHLRNIPVVIVAPSIVNTARNPFAELQIAVDAPYKTGADFNGKTMAVPTLGDINALATKAWVDKNGGDWRSVKFVEIPNVAIAAAIAEHRVAGAILQSPQLDASVAAGTTKTLADAYSAIAPVFMGAAYVARGDWAAQHAETLRRFVRVLAEAAGYVNTHPAETAPLVAELTKIEIANTAKMHRTLNGTTLDAALVQPVIDAAAKYELIARTFPARELFWDGGAK
jgi:NitT/TauT family transport system substrate-binding protein